METLAKVQHSTPQQDSLRHTISGGQNTFHLGNNAIQQAITTNEDGVQPKNHVHTCRTSGPYVFAKTI